jgi:thiol-disulfide isomerase/thioredoxin
MMMPVVNAYGRAECRYSIDACRLVNKAKEDKLISSLSEYKDNADLAQMEPKAYKSAPKVYVNKSTFIGGYDGLYQFLHIQRLIRPKRMFLVITASWCGPCKNLKQSLNWTMSTQASSVKYSSDHADSLCITLDGQEKFDEAMLLQNDVPRVTGYPTILEYQGGRWIKATEDRPALIALMLQSKK